MFINTMAREDLTKKGKIDFTVENVRKQALCRSGGRTLLTEGKVCAKALGQEHA